MEPQITGTDLFRDIPRGLPNRYLKDQSIPQARFQSLERITEQSILDYNPDKPGGKILIGEVGGKLLGLADNRHMGTIGGNRSGKSVGVVNNLIFYDGSTFTLDPKGEHANRTARRRAELGQEVRILDPFNRTKGAARAYRCSYNPLAVLSLDNDAVIEQAMQIVDGLIVTSGMEHDPYWQEAAGDALLGIILYVKFGADIAEADRNLITVRKIVREILKTIEDDEGNASYIWKIRIVQGVRHLYKNCNGDIADAIIGAVQGFYEKPSKERGGVLSKMRQNTAWLDFRSMKPVLSGHDFDIRNLKRKKLSIYLCLPATRMTMCKRWLRILVNQLVDELEFEETVPGIPVLAILDEFPVLGRMERLEDAIGQVASFHLRIWFLLQDWSQGKTLYKERWDSFTANAGVLQCFAMTDLPTTEYVSRRLGKTPVQALRRNDTGHDEIERGRAGRSESHELYDLLTPDEVSRVFGRADPFKRQLILMAGLHPMINSRVEYWDSNTSYHTHFRGKYEQL